MRPQDLLQPRSEGLYCPPGDFWIDPVRPVARAVITHGHSDHARAGHGAVLATPETLEIMKERYGVGFAGRSQAAGYGEAVTHGGVSLTLLPAGHILGSAQVRVAFGGLVMVVSGDYKRRRDPTCRPFEPSPCDIFITEATFGLPVFRHPHDRGEIARLLRSREQFADRTHLVGVYALGKAQRLARLLREQGYERPLYVHGALERLNALYAAHGVDLGPMTPVAGASGDLAGEIVLCPPSALADRWSRRFADPVTAFASGWMGVRARARQRGIELPLVISDHADWDELTATVTEIAPGELWITHGREEGLLRWAELNGLPARALALVGYAEEEGEAA